MKRSLMALALPLLAVCGGAAAPATLDAALLASQGPAETARAWLASAALCSMALAAVGLALGLAGLALSRRQDLALVTAGAVTRARGWLGVHGRRPATVSWFYAAAVALALFLVAGAALARWCFTAFKNLDLAAVLFMALSLALLGVCAVALLLLRRVFRRALAAAAVRLGPLASLPAALIILVVLVGAVAAHLALGYRPVVELLDWRPLAYLVSTAALSVTALAAALGLRARRLGQGRPAGPLRRALPVAAALALLLSWGLCHLALERSAPLRTVLLDRCFGAARAHALIGLALDVDRDGHLSVLGGGDCAPTDPAVHPGAVEVPGNDRDDDCAGGDASRSSARRPTRGAYVAHPLPAALAGARPSFLLITLDGLRADHLGCQGYQRPTTPNLDRLARAAVLFERAYAHGPATHVAVPSLMTSLYPSRVPRKASGPRPRPVAHSALLMAEIFREAGYRTGAVLGSRVFDRELQLDQGFDHYNLDQAAYYEGKGAPGWDKDQPYPLVPAAIRFLRRSDRRPFLLWVHIMEPHPPWVRRGPPHDFGSDAIDAYDGELHFADAKVGQLLAALAALPAAKRTVVILTADHGAGFGARGHEGSLLYNEEIHVPLMVRVPGLAARRVRNPVGHVDLLPTMMNLGRVTRALATDGISLVPQLVRGEPTAGRAILVEHYLGLKGAAFSRAVIRGQHKLLFNAPHNTYHLYDLGRDPGERVDLAARRPAKLQALKAALGRFPAP